ncbi:MAG: Uma2 family endonuclease [Pirellulales bacterium]
MATALPPSAPVSAYDTLADLLESIGDVPLTRIRANPAPGTATEKDVVAIRDRERRLYELVDGVLVEKTMGCYESILALEIAHLIQTFLDHHDLGVVAGEGGMIRFPPGVRIPDVSFVAWTALPSTEALHQPILATAPALAVEVLSKKNTRKEMARKLREYFDGGVEQVWYLDPKKRTMQVFSAIDRSTIFDENSLVDGGDVLPGFTMRVADVFARADRKRP